ncbi:MAG: hypothetical protein KDJ29_18225 [Hyphomicrobiales bacterium]|nr:hypothetical protein [Hyphomicrobiales bacterium]
MKEICDKVRFAPYGDIGFWTLSEHLVSAETREKAEKDHLMGLFQVGNKPATGIIWKLKPEMKRIDLFSAEEVFENAPI